MEINSFRRLLHFAFAALKRGIRKGRSSINAKAIRNCEKLKSSDEYFRFQTETASAESVDDNLLN